MKNNRKIKIRLFSVGLTGNLKSTIIDRDRIIIPPGFKLPDEHQERINAGKTVKCRFYRICHDFSVCPGRYLKNGNAPDTIENWGCGYCPHISEPDKTPDAYWVFSQDFEYAAFKRTETKYAEMEKLEIPLENPIKQGILRQRIMLALAGINSGKAQEIIDLINIGENGYCYEIMSPNEEITAINANNRNEAIEKAGEHFKKDKIDYRLFEIDREGNPKEINYKFIYFLRHYPDSQTQKKGRRTSFFELHYLDRVYFLGQQKNKKSLCQAMEKIVKDDLDNAKLYAIQEKGRVKVNLHYYALYRARFFVKIDGTKYPLMSKKRVSAVQSAKEIAKSYKSASMIEFIEKYPSGKYKKELIHL